MLARVIDIKSVRYLIGFVVGLPATLAVLMFGFLAIVEGLPSLAGTGSFVFLNELAAATLGILGVVGAWVRICHTHVGLSRKLRLSIVRLLLCGVVAALLVATEFARYTDGRPVVLTMVAAIAFAGVLLLATPRRVET